MPDTIMTQKKIKILHVTFNMGIGGTEQVICQIIKNSDRDRFQHEVLCIDGSIGSLGNDLVADGIHIETTQRRPGTDFKLVGFVRHLIRVREIDVVHCHQYTPYFYGVLGAIRTGARVIFTEHGRFFPDRHNFKRRLINPLLAAVTEKITAISDSTANAVAKYEYINRSKIEIVYNGIKKIDSQDFRRDKLLGELGLTVDDCRYVGTISRIEPIKNQTMMIKAFFKVKQQVRDLKLILIGDGAKLPELKLLARSLGIEKDVIFTGFLDNPQRYISLFEIFLLSSFSEGTSMTLLEAMSLSKPCVVTDVGGNPEIVVDGETGIVVASDDSEKFAQAISSLLFDEKIRQTYGREGSNRFFQKFTASHMINSYQKLYLRN